MNVRIVRKQVEIEQDVRLNNGDLIMYKERIAYVVSHQDGPTYCSLIDFETGCFVCKERCSRKTTRKRIGAHLRGWAFGIHSAGIKYNKIEHYKKSQYDVALEIKVAAQSMCCGGVYATNVEEELENTEPLSERISDVCPHCGVVINEKSEEKKDDF